MVVQESLGWLLQPGTDPHQPRLFNLSRVAVLIPERKPSRDHQLAYDARVPGTTQLATSPSVPQLVPERSLEMMQLRETEARGIVPGDVRVPELKETPEGDLNRDFCRFRGGKISWPEQRS